MMVEEHGKKLKSFKEKIKTGPNKKYSHGYTGNTNTRSTKPTNMMVTESKPLLELSILMEINKISLLKN